MYNGLSTANDLSPEYLTKPYRLVSQCVHSLILIKMITLNNTKTNRSSRLGRLDFNVAQVVFCFLIRILSRQTDPMGLLNLVKVVY